MSTVNNKLYEFDEYVLNARERNLWHKNELVQMPPKVFDTLCMLVESHGNVLSKEEMLDEIWKDTFVNENNLSQNISALRKLFGTENSFIETVPTVGFRFAMPVESSSMDRFEKAKANGNYIVATQTQTRVVEESFENESTEQSFKGVFGNNRKYIFATAFTALIAVTLGLLFFYRSNGETKRTIHSASFDYEELTDTGNVNSSTISPNGKLVAYTKFKNIDDENGVTLNLLDIESRNSVEVKIENNIVPGFLQFSPDEKSIYFRTRGKKVQFQNVYKISKFGGYPTLVAKDVWGYFSISPDGEKLAYLGQNSEGTKHQIILQEIASGSKEVVLERPAANGVSVASYPVFSPDGKQLAFVPRQKSDLTPNFAVLNLSNRKEEIVETDFSTLGQVVWNPNGKGFYLLANEKGKQFQIWHLSYPEEELTRVTSDSNAYRYIEVSKDGTRLSANRLEMFSNVWVLPNGNKDQAQKLTHGGNEIGGLLTLQFMPNDKILFSGRRNSFDALWTVDAKGARVKRLTEHEIGLERHFAFSKNPGSVFYEFENRIWRMKPDGTNAEKLDLGQAKSFSSPAVSPDEKWLYYVKRDDEKTSIWKSSLERNESTLIAECKDYSAETFLKASPDGKHLSFVYTSLKESESAQTTTVNQQTFGFLNLETLEVKTIKVPAYNSSLHWSDEGKSFDYLSYTKDGAAILRQDLNQEQPAETVLELENEVIFRFDWSPDGKNLAIGRGNYKMDLIVLESKH